MRVSFTIFIFLSLLVSGCNSNCVKSQKCISEPAKKTAVKTIPKDSSKTELVKTDFFNEQKNELSENVKNALITKEGDSIKLTFSSGILFEHDSHQLSEEAKKNIHSLAEVLEKYPNSRISIYGHTDHAGTFQYNQGLSERRASAVADYLISQNIAVYRFKEIKGFGEKKPVKDNSTAEGRNFNRRVEISIFPQEENLFSSEIKNNQVQDENACYCYYDEFKNFVCKGTCDSWVKVSQEKIKDNNKKLNLGNHTGFTSHSNITTDAEEWGGSGVILKGRVLDAKTKKPIGAKIIYETLPDGSKAGFAESDSLNGDYSIVLEKGNHYGYSAKVNGYISISENIKIPLVEGYSEIRQDLYLVPIEEGQEIKLNNVFFQQSRAELLPSSYTELNQIVLFLKNNPTVVIELHGHTDNHGNPKTNYLLSQKRVEQIKNYLVSKGIPPRRILLKAFGGAKPVASNDSEETRKLNRRVEFKIVKK